MKARAIVHADVGKVELRDFELNDPPEGHVLVEATATAVSPGTELRCLAGRQPDAVPFPYIPGYSMAGTVVATGPGCRIQAGDRVYLNGTVDGGHLNVMWGGHASHAVARESDCIPVPDGLELVEASMAHLAAIAWNGVRMAEPRPDETVLVVGLGIIGQLCARLFQACGCRVVACDRAAGRVALASRTGLETAHVADCLEDAARPLVPHGADILVDATGAPAAIPDIIPLARDVPWGDPVVRGSRYMVQGSYPDAFAIPYQEAFRKELQFLIPRDCRPGQRKEMLDWMAAGRLQVRDLISDLRRPEQAPETYRELMDPAGGLLTVVFIW